MIEVEHYLHKILQFVHPLTPVETPLTQALGTVLAADLSAKVAVPPFTNSSMDGFAYRTGDIKNLFTESSLTDTPDGTHETLQVTLPVTGDIPAGDTELHSIVPGQAWRIMTGAPLPKGADSVVKVEDTNIAPGAVKLPKEITFKTRLKPGENIRNIGEDAQIGDLILRAGEVLTPASISSAVSVGYEHVTVHPRPRVAVISTGNELKPPGSSLAHGQIPDSNSILLSSLLQRNDATVVSVSTSRDKTEDFSKALKSAIRKSPDLIVTSGGISAGAYDVVKEFCSNDVQFVQVAMQPGKPQGFGIISLDDNTDTVYLATLPGNPVSVFVSFHVFVRPILQRLTGRSGVEPQRRTLAIAGSSWYSPPEKTQFVPVSLSKPARPGEFAVATPTHELGARSHFVASLHQADALAVIPRDTVQVKQWSLIDVIQI